MSYILDALRKSESERRQGRIPDLGQQVQLIHRPRKKTVPVALWIGLGLVLNAAVLALVFWPEKGLMGGLTAAPESEAKAIVAVAPEPADTAGAAPTQDKASKTETTKPGGGDPGAMANIEQPVKGTTQPDTTGAQVPAVPAVTPLQPTIIVPSWKTSAPTSPGAVADSGAAGYGERAPHLVELPMSFQRRIPTLVFNSHLYSSDPTASRIMINDNYLRMGEQFSGIRVEQITVDGVVLSLDGQRFRVGVVRNWTSPR
ncbi:general secretion pathway protein GspB [Marinobacter salicampi]|uniref:general secretion pathway protein GspB n=1 Tax=Marinobacter salicampi TaxID=435907 RepID=UPI00140B1DC1|nr:general secretion pathway protein GspB [Marinobacter salicampi]